MTRTRIIAMSDRRAILPIALAAALAGCRASDLAPDALSAAIIERVDSVMEGYLRMRSVPGISVTIVRNGDVLLSRGYGWMDAGHAAPVTGETVFELGSIKKPLTAAVVLHMAERELVGLDDPIGRWAPLVRVPGTPVRIRDMLHQVSGLPNVEDTEPITHLDFEPGTRWAYRNANFDLLDGVIEAASGRSFSRYFNDELAPPAGVQSLGMCDADGPRPPAMATGHSVRNGAVVTTEDACWLRGSTRDLAVWIDALFSGRVLADASLVAMMTPYTLADGTVGEYGFGLLLRPFRGLRRFSHTGHVEGFSAAFGYYPDLGSTIAVAGNSDALFDPDGVEMAVAAVLSGLESEEPAEARAGDGARFAGVYDAGEVRFAVEAARPDSLRLTMSLSDAPGTAYFSTALVRIGANEYAGADSPEAIRVEFEASRGPAGATNARIFAVGIPWDARRIE